MCQKNYSAFDPVTIGLIAQAAGPILGGGAKALGNIGAGKQSMLSLANSLNANAQTTQMFSQALAEKNAHESKIKSLVIVGVIAFVLVAIVVFVVKKS